MLPADVMWVLRVWKLRLTTGRHFGLRDAKWVARLHSIIEDTASLDMWASLYSIRERAREALAEPSDTSDLDAELVMGAWELATASWLGKVKPFQSRSARLLSRGRPLEFGDSTSMEAVKTAEGPYHAKLPPVSDLNLPEEAEWVYAHWLQFLRTGPKWKSLPVKEHLSIIQELRLWVRNHPWRRDALDTGMFIKPTKHTVAELLRQWQRDYVATSVRPVTAEGYAQKVNSYIIPNLGSIALSNLQPSHLQAFYRKAPRKRSDGWHRRTLTAFSATCAPYTE